MEVGTVQRVDIEQKMRSAYLSYAMSVITARALPDVRDGLKPVQRRILYAMHDMGLRPDRPTRKSARIVGEVLGKYHPHGDTAVYDAMVRMAQDFSMRYPLVDGQGNFGSIDGDGAAAMRYTEARLTAIGEELLIDIDKDTVDFVDNFDASLQEPSVLPGKLPNLLLNGVGGIAVGMATNIPPHNLGEISDAIAYLVDNYDRAEDVSLDDLMRFVQGPDFPTGGMILGSEGIRQAYATGKGRIIVRALAHVEEMRGSHQAVVVTELPYQVNKSNLVERIAKLVRDERIEGIGDLRDESDRTGMRIVIELKRGTEVDPVMEQLLKYTQLQTTFGANMLALVDGEPRLLPLKRALLHYIDHRYDVLVRRTRFELERALARAHILEGLLIALDNLDEVIATIRRSRTVDTARTNLMRRFKLSEEQAQAILDMQLRRLAALEQRRIQEEYEQILVRIEYLRELLASKEKMLGLVKQDVVDLKKAYGDPRRTRICESDDKGEFKAEDLVPDEDVCVLLTAEGLVRRLPASAYTSRRTNVPGMYARERDALAEIFVAHSQESIVFFTDKGSAYALPAHQVPDVSQQESGLPLADLVRLGNDERVIAMLHLPDEGDDLFVSMATRGGQIKRLALEELASLGRAGTTVIGLGDGDSLGCALLTKGEDELVMVTEQGNAIRFASDTVRPQGRSASGMRGISLKEDDRVAGMDVVREDGELLIVTDLGFAKRTPLAEYNTQGRGGQGALTVDASKTRISGPVVDARVVLADDEIILTTTGRDMQRMPISDIPRLGRATWGRLVTRTRRNAAIQVENDRVVAAVRLTSSLGGEDASSDEPEEQGAGSGDDGASAAVSRPRTRRRRASASASDRQAAADASPEPQPPTATRRSRSRSRSQSAAQETSAPASAGAEAPPEEEPQAAPTRPRRSRGTSAATPKPSESRPTAESTPASSDGESDSGTPKTAVTRRSRTRTVRKPPTRSRSQGSKADQSS